MPQRALPRVASGPDEFRNAWNEVVERIEFLGGLLDVNGSSGLTRIGTSLAVSLRRTCSYAKAGASGIPAADWSDPDHPILGVGTCIILIRNAAGKLVPSSGVEEVCENAFHGSVAPGWMPLFVERVDRRWSIIQPDCVSS